MQAFAPSGKGVASAANAAAEAKNIGRVAGAVSQAKGASMGARAAQAAGGALDVGGRALGRLAPVVAGAKIIYDTVNTDLTEEDDPLFGPHIDAFLWSVLDVITPTGVPERRTRADLGLDQLAAEREMAEGSLTVTDAEEDMQLPSGFEIPEGDLEAPEIIISP